MARATYGMAILIWAIVGTANAGDRLAQVRERGYLVCGVEADRPGFSMLVDDAWQGFDADLCRAAAAVILADARAVDFVPVAAADRFTRLQRGEIDMLARSTVWTLSRDAELGLAFPIAAIFDRPALVHSGGEPGSLDGATVCLAGGDWPAGRLLAVWQAAGHTVSVLQRETAADALAGLADASCAAAAFPVSDLPGQSDDAVAGAQILDQPVWPLGPALRQDDPELADLIRWTVHALVAAEAFDIGQEDAVAALADPSAASPALLALLTEDRLTGDMLGVGESWAAQALAAVGNYAEIYARAFGPDTARPMPRGPNAPVPVGGLLPVMPFY